MMMSDVRSCSSRRSSSRLAILELNLPTAQSQAVVDETPQFQLEITVREIGIEVGDRDDGHA